MSNKVLNAIFQIQHKNSTPAKEKGGESGSGKQEAPGDIRLFLPL